MKTLLLVRHAKSDWDAGVFSDFERPLNERGKRDAPAMAARLFEKKIPIDGLLASPAKRAAKTAKAFAGVYGLEKEKIFFLAGLYLPAAATFYPVIESAPDDWDHLAVFSHNNGITDFANELTNARIDNIPTCGIFAVKVYTDSWKDFREARKEFWFFDSPKSARH